jgi:hypothetical protein
MYVFNTRIFILYYLLLSIVLLSYHVLYLLRIFMIILSILIDLVLATGGAVHRGNSWGRIPDGAPPSSTPLELLPTPSAPNLQFRSLTALAAVLRINEVKSSID